ncbi:unnamed protein product [Fraxinus pennsylvanica]|uniref:Ribosomal eL28/Mak16 domain-containing protein n=1 Tax=Fraxinus pennsylvanica TaxID=56036 RepID=A0AAD1YW92_9LAMI|nr:unnamed protein product [Fraxinus pennsylvanica]
MGVSCHTTPPPHTTSHHHRTQIRAATNYSHDTTSPTAHQLHDKTSTANPAPLAVLGEPHIRRSVKQHPILFRVLRSAVKMATVPGQLIWEIVKKNNSFLVKEFGNGTAGVVFSKEPNNLYNLHSYKHSGLANKKTVTIQPGKDQSVLLATSKTKKQNKPASVLNKSVMKKEFSSMAKAVSNQVADNYYRPDLKKAALARLSVVHRSLKVAKSGPKKKNRQA